MELLCHWEFSYIHMYHFSVHFNTIVLSNRNFLALKAHNFRRDTSRGVCESTRQSYAGERLTHPDATGSECWMKIQYMKKRLHLRYLSRCRAPTSLLKYMLLLPSLELGVMQHNLTESNNEQQYHYINKLWCQCWTCCNSVAVYGSREDDPHGGGV